MTNSRQQREALFFNRHFADNTRAYCAHKFYTVATAAGRHFRALIDENCIGQRVLEYGCGKGDHALALALRGALITGIDVSVEGVRQAAAQARAEGLEDYLTFEVMNAEGLDFPDDYFDIVFGNSILHHLDLDNACPFSDVTRVQGTARLVRVVRQLPLAPPFCQMASLASGHRTGSTLKLSGEFHLILDQYTQ